MHDAGEDLLGCHFVVGAPLMVPRPERLELEWDAPCA